MNRQMTIEKMKDMRLHGMSEIYHRSMKEHLFSDYSTDEFIQLLIDTEWETRQNNKTKNLIKAAHFRMSVSSMDVDYTSKRNLDKTGLKDYFHFCFLNKKKISSSQGLLAWVKATWLTPWVTRPARTKSKPFISMLVK